LILKSLGIRNEELEKVLRQLENVRNKLREGVKKILEE